MVSRQSNKESIIRKYKILIIGAALLIGGIIISVPSQDLLEKMAVCDTNQIEFPLRGRWGTTVGFSTSILYEPKPLTLVCNIVENFGQTLILNVHFWDGGNGKMMKLPANAQIQDPNGVILHSIDFNDTISISFKPINTGNYRVIITNFEDREEYRKIDYHTMAPSIFIDFGSPTTAENLPGMALKAGVLIGDAARLAGLVVLIIGGIKLARRKKQASTVQQTSTEG
jgi:hypothetical protein